MRVNKKQVGWGAFALIVAAQLVPINRTNPPVTGEIDLPDDVRQIVEKSCYDCHSHTTRWPWYGYVAPASWMLAYHVHEGREHLNLSTWRELSPEKQKKMAHEMWEEVEEGEMPMGVYLLVHSEAKLSEPDMQALQKWSEKYGAHVDYGVVPESAGDTAESLEEDTASLE